MAMHSLARTALLFTLAYGMGAAQQTGGQGGGTPAPGPTTPHTPSPTIPGRNTIPQPPGGLNNPQQQTPFPEMPRPIFLSGRVMLSEGTPPPEPVMIERVCSSRVFQEGWTDSKGRFSFELGRNRGFADASVNSDGPGMGMPGNMGNMTNSRTPNQMGNSGPMGERNLFGCELRAALAGFRSEVINLTTRRSMDNPDVGTIILKRLANVEGLTISMTTYNAPKDAKKAFDKGRDLVKKNKLEEAQKQFEKAVEAYPKYAVAWYELGHVQEAQDRPEDAKKSYAEALKADSKLISPYDRMALMAVRERKWQDAADITERMIRLNPVDFPSAYFYNAVANLNLQKVDAAEKSATELLKLDPQHRVPKAEHIMAVVLAQKQDWAGAATHFKTYLQLVPSGPENELAKKQLAEVEKTIEAKRE